MEIFEVAKSINAVAMQGIESGQAIANAKYRPLLEAAKALVAYCETEGHQGRDVLFANLEKAIQKAESK